MKDFIAIRIAESLENIGNILEDILKELKQ